MCCQNL